MSDDTRNPMEGWQDGYAEANGVRLHYLRSGAGTPIVLSHGITDSGACWARVALALAERYDVIAYDARGHGLSDAPEGDYGAPTRAADLLGLLDALGLEQAILLGHSMGAETSATAAAEAPARFTKVILEDPPWRHPPVMASPEVAAGWATELRARRDQSIKAIMAEGHANSPAWTEADLYPWAISKQQVSPNVASIYATPRAPWQDLLPKITSPTLLITGDVDRGAIVPPEVVAIVQERCPNAQVVHVPGAGHNIRRDRFEPFMQHVLAFLEAA